MTRMRITALSLVVLAAVLLAGCGEDDTTGKKVVRNDDGILVAPFRGQYIEDLPRRPIAVAAGEGAVWVASMAGGVVSKIDPETNKRVGKPIVTDDAPYSIDAAFGKVWVATFQNDKLIQIDPESRKVVKTTKVDNRPFGMTHGFGSMWVTSIRNESISRIDPATGKRAAPRIQLSGPPYAVTTGLGYVWVTNIRDGLVEKIDPKTNKVVGDPIKTGTLPSAIAVAGGSLWVANAKGETNTRKGTGTPAQYDRKEPIKMGSVWRIDPDSGERIGASIETPVRPQAMAADDDWVWVVSVDADTLLQISVKTGKPVGRAIGIGNAPTDVALGFDRVWAPISREDKLAAYDPRLR